PTFTTSTQHKPRVPSITNSGHHEYPSITPLSLLHIKFSITTFSSTPSQSLSPPPSPLSSISILKVYAQQFYNQRCQYQSLHQQLTGAIDAIGSGGFVEEIDRTQLTGSMLPESIHRRFPAAAMYMAANEQNPNPIPSPPMLRRARRNTGDRSPFNPVIVLRGPTSNGSTPEAASVETGAGGFELFYDDEAGSGLRPLPASMSEFLLGSGFDRFLDQLSQIEANGLGRIDANPPASKAAIESMPTIEFQEKHIHTDPHCAVCKEAFELGTEAREMP
ncbi:hypothetical protein M8C21_033817, partial [Ambrosia artemisiifolia]